MSEVVGAKNMFRDETVELGLGFCVTCSACGERMVHVRARRISLLLLDVL